MGGAGRVRPGDPAVAIPGTGVPGIDETTVARRVAARLGCTYGEAGRYHPPARIAKLHAMARVYTIGHSTRSIEDFVELLRAHGVDTLVDIRRYPGSRRQPQFGRETLSAALAAVGIGYVHEEALGGRRAPAPASPNGWWRNEQFRGYADHMATPGFRAALDRLVRLAEQRTPAIMCAEAVPWRCHRSLTADALVARGVDVAHIVGPGRAEPHTLNPAARVGADGSVTYPPDQPSLL